MSATGRGLRSNISASGTRHIGTDLRFADGSCWSAGAPAMQTFSITLDDNSESLGSSSALTTAKWCSAPGWPQTYPTTQSLPAFVCTCGVVNVRLRVCGRVGAVARADSVDVRSRRLPDEVHLARASPLGAPRARAVAVMRSPAVSRGSVSDKVAVRAHSERVAALPDTAVAAAGRICSRRREEELQSECRHQQTSHPGFRAWLKNVVSISISVGRAALRGGGGGSPKLGRFHQQQSFSSSSTTATTSTSI